MRDAFVERLTQQASKNPDINLIVGDLGFSVIDDFASRFPQQFLNAGVAEQSMIGIAAGMAAARKKVFVYSIANFPTMRALEQIRNDVCYHNLDVSIVSVGAGLAYGPLGYSHHAVEDLAVMRALPGITIYSPSDPMEVYGCVDAICSTSGPNYLRLGKNREPKLQDHVPDLSRGEPVTLRSGSDLTMFVTGSIASVGIEVADFLYSDHQISLRVVSVPVIKPLHFADLQESAAGTQGIVTLEEHTLSGGFGSAVLEEFAVNNVRMDILPIGLNTNSRSEIGTQGYLRDRAGLSIMEIAQKILNFWSN